MVDRNIHGLTEAERAACAQFQIAPATFAQVKSVLLNMGWATACKPQPKGQKTERTQA